MHTGKVCEKCGGLIIECFAEKVIEKIFCFKVCENRHDSLEEREMTKDGKSPCAKCVYFISRRK